MRVRLDLLSPPEERLRLGEGFRVFVRIVVWRGEDVVQVPLGALFRRGDSWMVYRQMEDRAALSEVAIGRRNASVAEVVEGVAPAERVILHPGDRVSDGTRVAERGLEGG